VVLSGVEFSQMVSATLRKASFGCRRPSRPSRRVLGEVALEDLEDGALVLERRVRRARLAVVGRRLPAGALADEAALAPPDGGVVQGRALVAPARRVVALVLLVPAGEEPVGARVLELLGDEGRGVRVVD
jgi:hypothetical protein